MSHFTLLAALTKMQLAGEVPLLCGQREINDPYGDDSMDPCERSLVLLNINILYNVHSST